MQDDKTDEEKVNLPMFISKTCFTVQMNLFEDDCVKSTIQLPHCWLSLDGSHVKTR